ncbi:serine hydrolase [uncultured Erythrobacter sp.]|uniref:serine hydrolase domain-containing protein n=1 Tax=uncultured Erythrobacter sp. TaxID=263913 RepID=UPI002613558B|nr:serine hydrolase [uncultured Erythrobacter sp.]
MTRTRYLIALLTAPLMASTITSQAAFAEEASQETKHWGDPNLDYVSSAWPIEEGSDLIDIREVPVLGSGFFEVAPEDRDDGIAVGELGADGGDREMILGLAEAISQGQHGAIDSLLISYKGKLVFESYYQRGRINLSHPQASATKTYTSLALGRAIQLGYLTMDDLHKPVISFLNDIDRSDLVEGADKVTLHQALTMRSGIRIEGEKAEEFERYRDLIDGQKLVQSILEQSDPITDEVLTEFAYGNYSSMIVMQVIDSVVPGSAENFIKTELLQKMGIAGYEWRIGLGGLPAGGWKSSFTSRDMLKFGTLAMSKGQWNGEQLIAEAYIAKATSRILYNGDDRIFGGGKDVSGQGYGYFWWSGDLRMGDKTYFASSAQGGGGQFIILIEELDLVVVTTAGMREPTALQIAAEKIVPAFAD